MLSLLCLPFTYPFQGTVTEEWRSTLASCLVTTAKLKMRNTISNNHQWLDRLFVWRLLSRWSGEPNCLFLVEDTNLSPSPFHSHQFSQNLYEIIFAIPALVSNVTKTDYRNRLIEIFLRNKGERAKKKKNKTKKSQKTKTNKPPKKQQKTPKIQNQPTKKPKHKKPTPTQIKQKTTKQKPNKHNKPKKQTSQKTQISGSNAC